MFDSGRYRSRSPKPPIQCAPAQAELSFAGKFKAAPVDRSVFLSQSAVPMVILMSRAREHRHPMAPVMKRYRLNIYSPPSSLERVDPKLPIFVAAKFRVVTTDLFIQFSPHQRGMTE